MLCEFRNTKLLVDTTADNPEHTKAIKVWTECSIDIDQMSTNVS